MEARMAFKIGIRSNPRALVAIRRVATDQQSTQSWSQMGKMYAKDVAAALRADYRPLGKPDAVPVQAGAQA